MTTVRTLASFRYQMCILFKTFLMRTFFLSADCRSNLPWCRRRTLLSLSLRFNCRHRNNTTP